MNKVVNIVLGPREWLREIDESDAWDAGDSRCDVSIGVWEGENPNYDGLATDLDFPFYVVYADYTDGSTFGSESYGEVMFITADKSDAEDKKDDLLKDVSLQVPWNGYFASLNELRIVEVAHYGEWY